MRDRQLALRSGAAAARLVPIADDRIGLPLDAVEVIRDDLADRRLEAPQVRMLPLPEVFDFYRLQVLLFIPRRIIDLMALGPQERRDLGPPMPPIVGRILDGA